jgi:hypothetical protein
MEINPIIKQKILSQKIFRGKILSESMEPVIKKDEEIVVEVKAVNLQRFDIIVFEDGNKFICHYIWSINKLIEPKLIQTRSLRGPKDFPFKQEQYVGKVISHRLSYWRKIKILLFN